MLSFNVLSLFGCSANEVKAFFIFRLLQQQSSQTKISFGMVQFRSFSQMLFSFVHVFLEASIPVQIVDPEQEDGFFVSALCSLLYDLAGVSHQFGAKFSGCHQLLKTLKCVGHSLFGSCVQQLGSFRWVCWASLAL